MSSGGSLDANILLRLIVGDVPEQYRAANQLLNKVDSLSISDLAIIEALFALERYYKVPRSETPDVIAALSANPKLNFNRKLFDMAIPIYVEHPKLSLEDCCLMSYAQLSNALPLWTFDQKLVKQSKNLAKYP